MILRLPDRRFTVVVLMNRGEGLANQIANKIAAYYFPAFFAPRPRIAKVSPAVLDRYAGYYGVHAPLFMVTSRDGRLFRTYGGITMELLPASEDTFFYADSSEDPEDQVRHIFVKDVQRRTMQIVFTVGGKAVIKDPYLGPLARSLTPRSDPDPALTQRVEAVMRASAQGGKAVEEVAGLAPGARKDLANDPLLDFAVLQSVSFLGVQDVAERGIERHGEMASRIVYYRFVTNKATRYALIYVTADGLITDQVVVDN